MKISGFLGGGFGTLGSPARFCIFSNCHFLTERQLDTELIINAISLQLFANPAARHFTAYLRHIFRELSLGPSNGVRVNKKGGLSLGSFKYAIAAVYPKRQTCRRISSDQAEADLKVRKCHCKLVSTYC